jgi:hypothetical protein
MQLPNVIVYGVAQLLTLRTYACQFFISAGTLTVKLLDGVISLFKSNATLAQVLATKLKSQYCISQPHHSASHQAGPEEVFVNICQAVQEFIALNVPVQVVYQQLLAN